MVEDVILRGRLDAFRVMPGLVPGIHAKTRRVSDKSAIAGAEACVETALNAPAWMAGTSPAMTASHMLAIGRGQRAC